MRRELQAQLRTMDRRHEQLLYPPREVKVGVRHPRGKFTEALARLHLVEVLRKELRQQAVLRKGEDRRSILRRVPALPNHRFGVTTGLVDSLPDRARINVEG